MNHCDDNALSLAALGEPLGETDAHHLRSCLHCRAQLDELSQVVALAKDAQIYLPLATPPPDVWQAIDAATHADPSASPPTFPTSRAKRSAGSDGADSNLRSLPPRRSWIVTLAAAAFGAIIGGAAIAGFISWSNTQGSVVASAQLRDVPGGPNNGQEGTATVVTTGDTRYLDIDTRGLPQPDGFYEVWLMDSQASRLVAMGTVPAGESSVRLPIPDALVLGDYPTVDISLEPWDGQPAHSAISVLRGQLDT